MDFETNRFKTFDTWLVPFHYMDHHRGLETFDRIGVEIVRSYSDEFTALGQAIREFGLDLSGRHPRDASRDTRPPLAAIQGPALA